MYVARCATNSAVLFKKRSNVSFFREKGKKIRGEVRTQKE